MESELSNEGIIKEDEQILYVEIRSILEEWLKLMESNKDHDRAESVEVCLQLGHSCIKLDLTQEAVNYYNKAKDLFEAINDSSLKGSYKHVTIIQLLAEAQGLLG